MTSPSPSAAMRRAVPLILAGPAAIGAALGLPEGPGSIVRGALTLPAIVIGVALLMLPALYIGAAFLGVAPRAQAVVRSAAAALTDAGVLFLGLSPLLLFLVASSIRPSSVQALGVLVVGLGVVLGLRALFVRLFDRRSMKALALFVCWALVSVGIGGQLFAQAILMS